MKKKGLALLLALVLLLTVTVGGTVAFLITRTNTITNTFTLGDFTYKLTLSANAPGSHPDIAVTMPELSPDSPQTVAAGSATFTTSGAPSITGYQFAGWYYDEAGSAAFAGASGNALTVCYGDTKDADESAEVIDITLYAKWTPITYKVNYYGNGSTAGSMEASVHTYDVSKNLTKNAFTRTGYSFVGWATSADGAKAYDDEASVVNLAVTQDAEVDLYALWSANDVGYQVVHHQQNVLNDDYTVADTESMTAKADSQVTPAVKSYTGFTSPSTQTVTVAPDGTTVVNYYYTRNSYTVTLEKDTGIASVSGAGSYKYGATVTIDADLSNGYQWEKWTGDYNDSSKSVSFTMPAKNVTNKAWAEPIVYTITYNLKNGALPSGTSNPTTYTVESAAFTLNNPGRTGHAFTGWTGSNGNTAQTTVTIPTGSTGNRTYTANWKLINFNVTLHKGTGISAVTGGGVKTYGNTVSINATVMPGYKWVNWTGYATTTTQNYEFTMPERDVTFTANATPITYTVKYNGNGATGGSTAASSHTYDTAKNLTGNGFTKTGYTFAGWATSASGNVVYNNGASVTNLASTNGATVNLYAKWTPITYKVQYNGNGATGGSTAASTHTYDTAKNLTGNGFTKTGYTFAGWATSANGSVVYSNNASVKNLASTNGATVNLYAKWTANTYRVIYHANNTRDINQSSTVIETITYDRNFTIKGNTTFTYGGNMLAGWSTEPVSNFDASGKMNRDDIPIPGGRVATYNDYPCGSTKKNLSTGEDVHLYAIWTNGAVEIWSPVTGWGGTTDNYEDYLWQEHPSEQYNNIPKDHLYPHQLGYISTTGANVYRYTYEGVIFDITCMNYFRFDIRIEDNGKTIYDLMSMGSGQLEFSSSGTCDQNEMAIKWTTLWQNSYWKQHTIGDSSWYTVYVPLSAFNNVGCNKMAINFVGVYWDANSAGNGGIRGFMCDPRFEPTLPNGYTKINYGG